MTEASLPWEVYLPLRQFLTITECPARWKHFNLYLVQDEQVSFYVGQSHCAFERVWDHIRSGPHGHSILGRFLLVNWPRSGRFQIGLMSANAPRFTAHAHSLDAAERSLIEELTPCFNVSLNRQPGQLPGEYLPPNAPIKYLKNYKRMLREAELSIRAEKQDAEWG